ncbi:hypothetical protein A4A49_52066 [Nicotiana attenuata]|uniref:Uncharacterized protein n=1 Tax=Nicotiana attenuata TaxID=49451 RepID=A0A1J6J0F6_NICAT|nr:hypothetical protein A4A49_52066 [Nicotiana attenuata]
MGLPDGFPQARPMAQKEAPSGSNMDIHEIYGKKILYSTILTDAMGSTTTPNHQEQEAVKARRTIHNDLDSLKKISLKGSVKIGVYDNVNVFMSFMNDVDFNIVAEVGTPVELDVSTKGMTRPSMAKVRVEIDLLRPLVTSVWVGNEDDNSPFK